MPTLETSGDTLGHRKTRAGITDLRKKEELGKPADQHLPRGLCCRPSAAAALTGRQGEGRLRTPPRLPAPTSATTLRRLMCDSSRSSSQETPSF